jgi:hypothetical protein
LRNPSSRFKVHGVVLAAWAALAGAAEAQTIGGLWLPQGPSPIGDGQVENVPPNNPVAGAIHTIATHPNNPNQIWIGGVNGGIWRTLNAMSPTPNWIPLTDQQRSLSISAMELDPTDRTYRTLVAGTGNYSSFGSAGRNLGLLRTRNAGITWTALDGGGLLVGKNISGVAARGATIVASVNRADVNAIGNLGIFRSTDTGATFTQISNGTGTTTGLPLGITHDLVGDPNKRTRLFTSVVAATLVGGANGIYRSNDTGATWTKVSNPAIDAFLITNVTNNVEFAVGQHNNVFVGIANQGRLAAVFRSGDGGTTWTQMDLPLTDEGGILQGVHPGRQSSIHMSIVADPTDPNIVYIGGDRQPFFGEGLGGPVIFPNAIGAENFAGRLFRGNASLPTGSQWSHLTNSNALGAPGGGTASNSSPHADSREMAFDALGNLIESDDGGIYKRTNPRDNTGDWFPLIGNLQTTELHAIEYDNQSDILFGGTQDVGVPVQDVAFDPAFSSLLQGDGGDAQVDDVSTPGVSIRLTSNQFLGNFNRTFWDPANTFLAFDFPALTTVGGGADLVPSFYTPIRLNAVDPSRLVIGAGNSVYESADLGDTVVEIAPGLITNGGGNDPIAYGSPTNPDLLWIGAGANVFVRTGPHPAPLLATPFPGGGQVVREIKLDPQDGSKAFVINPLGVFRTVDTGASWTNITGNLPTLDPGTYRSLDYIETPFGDAIVVGTLAGVAIASEADGFAQWYRLGWFLPRTPFFEVIYNAEEDALLASALGRGIWRLDGMTFAVLQLLFGTPANQPPAGAAPAAGG